MSKKVFSKARVQIEDIIVHKGKLRASALIILGVVNARAYNILKERAKKFPTVHPYPYALGDQDRLGV